MPIAMLLHTDGAHERPGGKQAAFRGLSSFPSCENLQRLSCRCLEVLTLLNLQGNIVFVFAFVVILLTDIWGVISVGEAALSVTWEFIYTHLLWN